MMSCPPDDAAVLERVAEWEALGEVLFLTDEEERALRQEHVPDLTAALHREAGLPLREARRQAEREVNGYIIDAKCLGSFQDWEDFKERCVREWRENPVEERAYLDYAFGRDPRPFEVFMAERLRAQPTGPARRDQARPRERRPSRRVSSGCRAGPDDPAPEADDVDAGGAA